MVLWLRTSKTVVSLRKIECYLIFLFSERQFLTFSTLKFGDVHFVTFLYFTSNVRTATKIKCFTIIDLVFLVKISKQPLNLKK